METTQIDSVLGSYKNIVENEILLSIPALGSASPLRDACEYALTAGGKRYRPIITLLVAEALGLGAVVLPAALAVEFFHTASLVADDLPCMDDDDERRNNPSTHRKHGEAVALLVSYALIAAGYESLVKNTQLLASSGVCLASAAAQVCVVALENATQNTGLCGATGGQFMDIYPPDLTISTVRDVIHKKTVSLFEVAFVFGWIFGGGALESLDDVKRLASHYGMAFQIADDIDDVEQDAVNGRKVNVAAIAGLRGAIQMFHEEINGYKLMLNKLKINTTPLQQLATSLEEIVCLRELDRPT